MNYSKLVGAPAALHSKGLCHAFCADVKFMGQTKVNNVDAKM